MSFRRGAHIVPFRGKVHDILSEGMLIAEVDARHAVRPESCPKFDLGRRHIAMQLFCPPEDFRRGAFMHLTPTLPSPNWRTQLGEESTGLGRLLLYA